MKRIILVLIEYCISLSRLLKCNHCKQVDPSPIRWNHGHLDVENVWERIAVDITYVNGRPYLTLIDCGPSRFTIWIKLKTETADEIIGQFSGIFKERGSQFCAIMDLVLKVRRQKIF